MNHVELFTDGSCIGNPGPGGWGYLLRIEAKEQKGSGGEPDTTNNRMELKAVIEGLKEITQMDESLKKVTVFSDSSWVVFTMTKNWKRKKNKDLWLALDELIHSHRLQVSWEWVKGHAGHRENEICDQLAQAEALKQAKSNRRMERPSLF